MQTCAWKEYGVYDMSANNKKSNAGRPTVMTADVLAKLEAAFSWGCTDNEACIWANINPSSLYDYQLAHPEFTKRKELLKDTPNLKARQVINMALQQKDKQAAQWWLERKRKEEFSTRSEMVQPEPIRVYVTKEEREEADSIIDAVVKPREKRK